MKKKTKKNAYAKGHVWLVMAALQINFAVLLSAGHSHLQHFKRVLPVLDMPLVLKGVDFRLSGDFAGCSLSEQLYIRTV